MKRIIVIFLVLFFIAPVFASAAERVRGYTRRDGTHVQSYHRSSPNRTPTDNYRFKGNLNPYTGKIGQDRYRDNPKSPYYDGGYGNRSIFDD
jgi:hypothetical protein